MEATEVPGDAEDGNVTGRVTNTRITARSGFEAPPDFRFFEVERAAWHDNALNGALDVENEPRMPITPKKPGVPR
jgi:hypothetical protein